MLSKKVFISHSKSEKRVASAISDFMENIGVKKESIFSFSVPETGVKEKIPNEIKEALKSSCFDIIILSQNYLESDYCLNEAGIIWYKQTEDVGGEHCMIIRTPDITFDDRIGFFNGLHELFYNVQDKDLGKRIYEKIANKKIFPKRSEVSEKNLETFNKALTADIRDWFAALPVFENLNWEDKSGIKNYEEEDIKNSFEKISYVTSKYMKQIARQTVFYDSYHRHVTIEQGKKEKIF